MLWLVSWFPRAEKSPRWLHLEPVSCVEPSDRSHNIDCLVYSYRLIHNPSLCGPCANRQRSSLYILQSVRYYEVRTEMTFLASVRLEYWFGDWLFWLSLDLCRQLSGKVPYCRPQPLWPALLTTQYSVSLCCIVWRPAESLSIVSRVSTFRFSPSSCILTCFSIFSFILQEVCKTRNVYNTSGHKMWGELIILEI